MTIENFKSINPILQALIATGFTYFLTILGAGLVFIFKSVNKRILDGMLGFAAGIMIAASFWSLLQPAIEMAEELNRPAWIPAVSGFLLGGIFIWIIDKILPHLHIGFQTEEKEGIRTNWHRSILLVLAITLHNIPEGLAIGVAFGALSANSTSASLGSALGLALGIGVQNFPEGLSASIPLRKEGFSRIKSFWYGQLSGIVEPIAGIIGVTATMFIESILPYVLSFAAGAMIFVVAEELIPVSHLEEKHTHIATIGTMFGFAVMMTLDVALG